VCGLEVETDQRLCIRVNQGGAGLSRQLDRLCRCVTIDLTEVQEEIPGGLHSPDKEPITRVPRVRYADVERIRNRCWTSDDACASSDQKHSASIPRPVKASVWSCARTVHQGMSSWQGGTGSDIHHAQQIKATGLSVQPSAWSCFPRASIGGLLGELRRPGKGWISAAPPATLRSAVSPELYPESRIPALDRV